MALPRSDDLIITFRTLNGMKNVVVRGTDTIGYLKREIWAETGIPPERQRFTCSTPLDDEQKISSSEEVMRGGFSVLEQELRLPPSQPRAEGGATELKVSAGGVQPPIPDTGAPADASSALSSSGLFSASAGKASAPSPPIAAAPKAFEEKKRTLLVEEKKLPTDTAEGKSSRHYMDYRKKPEKIEDYILIGGKTGGVSSTGNVYRPKDRKRSKEKHLIKDTPAVITINNFISSTIYKQLLGFQTSEDSILINKDDLKIKSLFLEGFKAINESAESTMALAVEHLIKQENARGFEEVIAASLFLCEADPNSGNLGVITTNDGSKFFAKIDHEQSSSMTTRFNVPEARLHDVYIRSSKATYGEDLLISDKLASACEKLAKINLQPLYYAIEYAMDKVEQTLKNHPDTNHIIYNLVIPAWGLNLINQKLYIALKNTTGYSQIDDSVKYLIDREIKESADEENRFEIIKKYFNKKGQDINHILLCIHKENLFSLLEIRKSHMQELADVIRLEVAVTNRDYERFQMILTNNPGLMGDFLRARTLKYFIDAADEKNSLIPPMKDWIDKIDVIRTELKEVLTERPELKTETLEAKHVVVSGKSLVDIHAQINAAMNKQLESSEPATPSSMKHKKQAMPKEIKKIIATYFSIDIAMRYGDHIERMCEKLFENTHVPSTSKKIEFSTQTAAILMQMSTAENDANLGPTRSHRLK